MRSFIPFREIKWEHTISIKVLLFFILVLIRLTPLVAEGYMMSWSFRQMQIEGRVIRIQNQCLILNNEMTRSGYLSADSPDPLIIGEMDVIANVLSGQVILVGKNFKVIGDTFKLAVGKTNVSGGVIRCSQGENSNRHHKDKHYITLTAPVYDGIPEKNIEDVLVVTGSTKNLLALVEKASEKATFLQVMILQVLVMLVFRPIALLVWPFKRLQARLNRVAQGNLDEPITEHTCKETREISSAVTTTLTRLKTVDQSREEFVSNMSHKLKTPITSIRVLTDPLMGMEEVPVELYREFTMDISDKIDKESKVIDDLLSPVKMDKAAAGINITQVDINTLLRLALRRLRPIAKKRNVELIFESTREVVADVDEVRLSLALSNLVENAIKYNVEGGWVRVVLNADHKLSYVKAAGSGCSIPEEPQENIFERFYRANKARSRETEGTRFGLAITRKVVLMHKGAIKVIDKEGEGSTFTMRMSLAYTP